jgi:hypothetical protein
MERYKTVKEKKDLYIEFTEEEIAELGWEDNQKLSITVNDDKSISIKPWVKVDIDISGWPSELYEMLVEMSLEQDKTVNQIIVDLIEKNLKIKEPYEL